MGFLIGIYNEYDELLNICDNVRDFAHLYDIELDNASSIISRIHKGLQKTFNHRGLRMKIVLIPLDPEEISELINERE